MHVVFKDNNLDRLETESHFNAHLPVGVVKSYRKVMQWIRAAQDERDLRAYKALRFEKLKEKRCHQHSMRLNNQYRLIVELQHLPQGSTIKIMEISDYH